MTDMEKVIKGLEHCFHGQECCGDIECPYYIEHLSDSCCLEECQDNLKADVLALLKLQQLDIEALKKTIQGMVEGQCIIAGDKRVDVVRCKDCKHYNIIGCAGGFGWCERYDVGHTDEWFCADGKRKEGL